MAWPVTLEDIEAARLRLALGDVPPEWAAARLADEKTYDADDASPTLWSVPKPAVRAFDWSVLVMHTSHQEPALAEIGHLAGLDENWNSYDAGPISLTVVRLAQTIVRNALDRVRMTSFKWVSPRVSPTPDGRVYLDWRRPGRRLVIVVGDQGIKVIGDRAPEEMSASTDGEIRAVAAIMDALS